MDKLLKILVPIDFSMTSRHALDFALSIANLLQAEIHVLHVIFPQLEDLDHPGVSSAEATRTRQNAVLKKMKSILEEAETNLKKEGRPIPKVDLFVETGGAISVIKKQVIQQRFDLVVMGTRSQHANYEILLGTVASDVVGNVTCPVIVVPEDVQLKQTFKVAHALDTDWIKVEKILKVIRLFQPLHQEVHLVRYSKIPDEKPLSGLSELETKIAALLPGVSINSHAHQEVDLIQDVNQFVQAEHIDLLIMYRSQHNLFRKLFHRSLTRQMAKMTVTPLLVV